MLIDHRSKLEIIIQQDNNYLKAMQAPPITEHQLEQTLQWLQGISFSRIPKSISRDFSDAVLMAQIMRQYYPQYVQLHNYQPANSTAAKYINWKMLTEKVFRKVSILIAKSDIQAIVSCANGAIQRVLCMVYKKITSNQQQMHTTNLTARLSQLGNTSPKKPNFPLLQGSLSSSMQRKSVEDREQQKANFAKQLSLQMAEKQMVIKQLRETIQILQTKMKKMEQLNKLKDAKIDSLMRKLDEGIGL